MENPGYLNGPTSGGGVGNERLSHVSDEGGETSRCRVSGLLSEHGNQTNRQLLVVIQVDDSISAADTEN